MNDLTFEQAALLSRWLSGEALHHSQKFTRTDGSYGRWIWDWSGGRIVEVWVPATLEQASAFLEDR